MIISAHILLSISTVQKSISILMKGTFEEGLKLVPAIENKLDEYALFVDQHRILVFNYKIATLYFGSRQI